MITTMNIQYLKLSYKTSYCTSFYLKTFEASGIKMKVRKRAKIMNQYNQASNLTHDTNGKVTTSQLDTTKRAKRSAFPQHVTTRHQQTDMHESITKQDRNNINDPQKKHRLRTVSKNILLEGLNRFNGAPTSPLVQIRIKTHRCLVCMKDP